ncbi:hypothetical protein RI367_001729 [Sorochytrium milnesiophthora]
MISTEIPFDAAIYVPVHYDFSQIEYVAPFLERFPGSKVFVYKWNGIRDKIVKYYRESTEYKHARLGVYDFSLKDIVKCILEEPVDKKVVFLLTTSMAYAFGPYQKQLLTLVKTELDTIADQLEKEAQRDHDEQKLHMAKKLRGKVWGVSVVGHCMYGCMSCKGNDHKVPVYYTRYFRKILPYTADDVRKQFDIQPGVSKPVHVLCAPSTGETCVLLHRPILEYLLKLEQEGHYKFVWKFHPAVYNVGDYSDTDEAHRKELDNVRWIFEHFTVTREDESCLLPFIDAFSAIFCDLHSSVPFIASYFAPKTIICYWNDADYEVPAGRDPAFLKNLNVFQQLEELPAILTGDKLPGPRGDQKFFWDMYGKVDGNEVDRFATLADWPRRPTDAVAQDEHPATLFASILRRSIANIAHAWSSVLDEAERKTQGQGGAELAEENYTKDCKMAIGLFEDIKMLPPQQSAGSTARRATNGADTAPQVKVMTWNMWHGSEACLKNKLLAGKNAMFNGGTLPWVTDPKDRVKLLRMTADVILKADVDVVCLQECSSLPLTDENQADAICSKGTRLDNSKLLADTLSENSGRPWHVIQQGILTPGAGNYSPWSMVSRLPILAQSPGKFGVKVQVDAHSLWVFNTHLPYFPYQPYQLQRPAIPYENQQPLRTAKEAQDSSLESRGAQVSQFTNDVRSVASDGLAVVVCGDFNEPSHLDWTNAATIAGYHPMPVEWPSSCNVQQQLGLRDAFRTVYPDPVAHPGWTWCAYNEEFASGQGDQEGWTTLGDGLRDKAERIDLVLYNERLEVSQVQVLGNQCAPSGRRHDTDGMVDVATPDDQWTSDHRAVVAAFHIRT